MWNTFKMKIHYIGYVRDAHRCGRPLTNKAKQTIDNIFIHTCPYV